MSLWQDNGAAQGYERNEGPTWQQTDDWHESISAERNSAKQRLDMNHGFVKMIKSIQHDRDEYDQRCREESAAQNARRGPVPHHNLQQAPVPDSQRRSGSGPLPAHQRVPQATGGMRSDALVPQWERSEIPTPQWERNGPPAPLQERNDPSGPPRERKQQKVRLGFGAYKPPNILAPAGPSIALETADAAPEVPAPRPAASHAAPAAPRRSEAPRAAPTRNASGGGYQQSHSPVHQGAASSPPGLQYQPATYTSRQVASDAAPTRSANSKAAAAEPAPQSASARRASVNEPAHAGPAGFAAAYGLEGKGRAGRDNPPPARDAVPAPRHAAPPAQAPTSTGPAAFASAFGLEDKGRVAEEKPRTGRNQPPPAREAPAREAPARAAPAAPTGEDEVPRISAQATASLRSHLVAAAMDRPAKVEGAPKTVPYVAGPRGAAAAAARGVSPEAPAGFPTRAVREPPREPGKSREYWEAAPPARQPTVRPSAEDASPVRKSKAKIRKKTRKSAGSPASAKGTESDVSSVQSESPPGIPFRGSQGGMRSAMHFGRGEDEADAAPVRPRQACGKSGLTGSSGVSPPEGFAPKAAPAAAAVSANHTPTPEPEAPSGPRPKLNMSSRLFKNALIRPSVPAPAARTAAAGGGASKAVGNSEEVEVKESDGGGRVVATEEKLPGLVLESATRMTTLRARQMGVLAILADLERRVSLV